MKSHITNENLFSIDGALESRQAMLKAMSGKVQRKGRAKIAPAVWMEDASGSDSRSVKAQLRGRTSLRAAWWNAFSRVHQLVKPSATLEDAMYAFHRMHHACTLYVLRTVMEYRSFSDSVQAAGLMKASRSYYRETMAELDDPANK